MWIVDWLVDHFSELYRLLVTYYDDVVDAAKHAFDWAVEQGERAFNRAKNFALGVLADAKAFADQLVDDALALLDTLYKQAISFAADIYNRAKAKADELIKPVIDLANALYQQAVQFAANQFNLAKAKAQELVDAAQATLSGLINGLSQDFETFKQATGLFDPFGQGFILDLIHDPVGTVIAIIEGAILDLIFYLLAVGLARPDTELPPPPTFGAYEGQKDGKHV